LNIKAFTDRKEYNQADIYSQTKLAQIVYTYKFNSLYKDKGVECFACHPGIVNSQFLRNSIATRVARVFLGQIMKSPKLGAYTTITLALKDFKEPKSLFFSEHQPVEPHRDALNTKIQDQLWELSLNELKQREQ
jgi:NAD(P)-dependent dehydrogenase (short-subunit alcohol dehydrogenase family)